MHIPIRPGKAPQVRNRLIRELMSLTGTPVSSRVLARKNYRTLALNELLVRVDEFRAMKKRVVAWRHDRARRQLALT
jgi:hypothetical protein